MKTYEALFILDERQVDDGGEAFAAEIEAAATGLGGKVKEKQSLGRKTFARAINKRNSGIYWDFVLDMPPDSIASFQDRYRLNHTVLRQQVVLYEPPPAPAPESSNR